MNAVAVLLERPQFTIPQAEKEVLLLAELNRLTDLHRTGCGPYKTLTDVFGGVQAETLGQLPYLPVSLFKTHHLQSIPDEEVFKLLTSSGTTGQAVSRIVLDRVTADLQTRALGAIIGSVVGKARLPMIIIDTKNIINDRAQFSARGAGVLGMMPFGRRHFHALNDEMELDAEGLISFLNENRESPVLIFGFTFMVWKYFHQQIVERGLDVDFSQGILIHSGGWKKLEEQRVGNAEFKWALRESCGIQRIHNFYGMVEQVGSVFLEGEDGYLYPSNFSDVIIRDPHTWAEMPDGHPGIVEVLSVLPRSYPGHVLLTEDIGVVHGIAESPSGPCGKRLEVIGRVPRTELRGCSDTHAYGNVTS